MSQAKHSDWLKSSLRFMLWVMIANESLWNVMHNDAEKCLDTLASLKSFVLSLQYTTRAQQWIRWNGKNSEEYELASSQIWKIICTIMAISLINIYNLRSTFPESEVLDTTLLVSLWSFPTHEVCQPMTDNCIENVLMNLNGQNSKLYCTLDLTVRDFLLFSSQHTDPQARAKPVLHQNRCNLVSPAHSFLLMLL